MGVEVQVDVQVDVQVWNEWRTVRVDSRSTKYGVQNSEKAASGPAACVLCLGSWVWQSRSLAIRHVFRRRLLQASGRTRGSLLSLDCSRFDADGGTAER